MKEPTSANKSRRSVGFMEVETTMNPLSSKSVNKSVSFDLVAQEDGIPISLSSSSRRSKFGDNIDNDDVVHGSIKLAAGSASMKIASHSTRISSKYHPKQPKNSPTVTIALILNAMLGAGILNQPKVFATSGIIGAFIGYALAAVSTWYGEVVLTAAGIEVDVLEYSSLAKKAFGTFGEKLVDFSIVIVCFASLLGFLIIITFTTTELLHSWGCPANGCSNVLVTVLIVGLFITPTCFYRHMGHLGLISLFSFLATVGVAFLVWVFGPYQHFIAHYPSNYIILDWQGTLSSMGSIIFAISATFGNFHAFVSTEEEFQDLPHWTAITGITTIIGCIISASMGLIGYLSFESQTAGNILDNFPQHAYDFFKLLMVIHLIMSFPVMFIVTRYSFVKICTGDKSEDLPIWNHIVITISLVVLIADIIVMLMSAGYSSGAAITLIFNLAGGIGGKSYRHCFTG